MIGSAVMNKLIAEGSYDITIVSRGSWPYNTSVDIGEHVRSIECDRDICAEIEFTEEEECGNGLDYCEELLELVQETEKFDYVLDFSGFMPLWVEDSVSLLEKKADVYIYISTDSLYDVSETSPNNVRTNETEIKRPEDAEKREEVNELQEYGDEKLQCEEYLMEQRSAGGIPWVALRFADVIGPMDGSYRWQSYQTWLMLYDNLKVPINVPEHAKDLVESITYVEDAADSVILSMKTPSAWDNAFNIAMEEEFKLWDIVELMAKVIGVERALEQEDRDEDAHFYPSVQHGAMDISKAKEMLGFKPTSPEVAFKATAEWYTNIFLQDEEERVTMLTTLVDSGAIPEENDNDFFEAVAMFLEKHGIDFDGLESEQFEDEEDEEFEYEEGEEDEEGEHDEEEDEEEF